MERKTYYEDKQSGDKVFFFAYAVAARYQTNHRYDQTGSGERDASENVG